jgi:hypothetical protein
MDNKELLKSVLQDVINDRMEQAEVTMHNYFVSKTREVTGLGGQPEDELEAELEAEASADSEE